jgi:Apea-like HEPN
MTNDHTDDAALIAALNDASEPARRCFEHYATQERLGVWLERPSPDLDEIKQPIVVAMETHPKFRNATSRFFGSKQLMLHSRYQSTNVLKIAVERSSAAAVTWCHKVYSTERADIRYVAEVYGLKVTEPLKLSNGVSLMPLETLPPSENAKAVQSQFSPRPGSWNMPATSIPIGATYEVPAVVGSLQFEERSDVSPRSHILETTIKAFTLVLPPDIKTQCDIAIERLNLARRRLSIEDKTIDGAICLKALLGDGNKQEITYRLRLRAALLLSKDLKERREISKAVRDFYTLRSTAVHGDRSKLRDAEKNNACAAQGLDICARALRAIVSLEKEYVAEDWELSGGQ